MTGIVLALLATAISTAVAWLVEAIMPHASLALVFLTGVLLVAARAGIGPALTASVLGLLALNFFFTPPRYTLAVADDGDIATLAFFLVIAALTGNLAARMRAEMAKRRDSLRRISVLYEFSRQLSATVDSGEVRQVLRERLRQSLGRTVDIYLSGKNGTGSFLTPAGPAQHCPQEDLQRALAMEGEVSHHVAPWSYLKLSMDGEPAVVVMSGTLDAEEEATARSLCDLAGNALQRIALGEELEQVRVAAETEQLRAALLSSVSHDLRTPLASIIGSSTSLLEYGESFTAATRKDLLAAVVGQAQRLDRHIQNLLDMTRLGQGSLSLTRDWADVNDIIASALSRLEVVLADLHVEIEVAPDVPLLYVHGVLVEQALVNLLDNAARFSPVGGQLLVQVEADQETVCISICDQGPGIPEPERERIFDMFYTISRGDSGDLQGTGLGLAICRGMIAAHGGTVSAHDGLNGSGSCMRIRLPVLQYAAVVQQ
ncbi:DUF4118 domain-containing protein [Kineobactrum salinum]|uniref:histidine kinase n=1 Tax=Kineobactrum salinum TaxID=2708301 RepID=A0A6C0TWV8_9GAMM|nr:DUF4118 domain-containing protein [Kineobactrum salinum]QIB64271.1 DUF4118 domain-containing protein [Kineobactrum salinum]